MDRPAGMHPGDLIIVAGRPGMGKTSFALNVGVNAAHSRVGTAKKAGVAIFSLEMPKDQLFTGMLASEARVDAQRMRNGRLDREDWNRIAQAAGTLSELPLFIDDTPPTAELCANGRIDASAPVTVQAPTVPARNRIISIT